MDYVYDGNQLTEIAVKLFEGAETVQDIISSIYDGVSAMNDGWQGPSYDDFKTKAESYRVYLEALHQTLRVYESMILTQLMGANGFVAFRDHINNAYSKLGGE